MGCHSFSRILSWPRDQIWVSSVASRFFTIWDTGEAPPAVLTAYNSKHRLLWLSLFSCSVVSDSSWPHGLQHARLPCPLPSPETCSNSCPLSQWCHPTISSSVVHFSSCLQYFAVSGSLLMSQLFTSGGQIIGASTSASVFPINSQCWFPLGLTDLTLQS